MIGSGIAVVITSCFYNALGIFPATMLIAAGLTGVSKKQTSLTVVMYSRSYRCLD
ncbi:hypothetical protein HXA35_05605 [Bacillus sp. A301a_S52]|nr:hypothetical protein [Bacillus sp. A301a_S52]